VCLFVAQNIRQGESSCARLGTAVCCDCQCECAITSTKTKEKVKKLISTMSSAKFFKKIKSMIKVTSSAGVIFGGMSFYRNDESFFDNIAMPLTRMLLDAETAHRMAVVACKWNILPANNYEDPKTLVRICGWLTKIRANNIFFLRKHKFVVSNLKILLALLLVLIKMEKLFKGCTSWARQMLLTTENKTFQYHDFNRFRIRRNWQCLP
jgi:hypothetical protein